MALWACRACTTAYAVGAPACPHCGSTEHEEASDMPKITRHGGPSIYDPDAATPEEVPSSPGSSSSTSPEKPETSSEQSEQPRRRRARTTGNRSGRGRTGDSSAPSTVGGQTAADE